MCKKVGIKKSNLDKVQRLKCKTTGLILSLIKTQGLWCKSDI
jgi:hypothetical protein